MEERTAKGIQVPIDFDKHVQYILDLEHKSKTSDALYFTDHKRLSGVYWALSSLALLDRLDALPKQHILDYVMSCYDADQAAFAGNTDQDVHLLYTVSGVQILALYDALHLIDADAVVRSVSQLQQPDGSFAGDKWGEIDTRFTYCAFLILSILGRLPDAPIDLDKAVRFIRRCQNFDGGFGCIPDAESHAGQVFCCVGALSLAGALKNVRDAGEEEEDGTDDEDIDLNDRLVLWLCERQLPCGGLNGRPDKLEDVCYSWWVLSSLAMLGCIDVIDGERLAEFIGRCQDVGDHGGEGGFADRPGDMADVFHTFFGLAGLSLLGDRRLREINASFALPTHVVTRLPGRA